jgi:hypothetical protein
MLPEEIVYIKVKGFGKCVSDHCIGYNDVRKKFYKSAFIYGRYRQVFTHDYIGSGTVWDINTKGF